MKMSKKALWSTVIILFTLLTLESYICRNHIKETFKYYVNKINTCYTDYKNHKKALNDSHEFISCEIPQKTVLIFEPNPYHHECIPGYAKYFTDLGYNVDLLITPEGKDAISLFEPQNKLRIFTFSDLNQVNLIATELSEKFYQYDYVLLNTSDPWKKDLLCKLGFFENPRALFVTHDIEFMQELGIEDYYEKNKVLVLGDFKKGLYVNPHYFKETHSSSKNNKVRFFITSTAGRNYDILINAAKNLKNMGLEFEIMVVGRSNLLNSESIPENLKDCFIFKHNIPYTEMYEEVQKSDYTIILLDPRNEYDNIFRTCRVTGTAQLAYGFSKPVVINKEFSDFYKLNDTTGFVYSSENLTSSMKSAIKLSPEKYSELCKNMYSLTNNIYEESLQNLKKALGITG